PYDPKKVFRSCIRAGASREEAEDILREVNGILYDGITTGEIYTRVEEALGNLDNVKASKYRLKDALMRLGPAGFSFETYIAKVLERYGYETRVRTLMKGRCAIHEVDIIAYEIRRSPIIKYMIECKYHNHHGIYTGLKEAMYTHARFLDLKNGFELDLCERFDGAWLITNTKFSLEAVEYAKCTGMTLLGWSYPSDTSLQRMIECRDLYPITILKNIHADEVHRFFRMDLVTLNDIAKRSLKELHRVTGISEDRLSKIKAEAEKIAGNP
ncbi:MAG: restriction endonuclease, partial [Candidatus Bathyarchaeia archaeon]